MLIYTIKILKLLSFRVNLRRIYYRAGEKKKKKSVDIELDWNYVLITKASIILDMAVLVITFERIVVDRF